MEKPILIASSSHDEHSYGPVHAELEAHDFPVIVYKTDKVLEGEDKFTLCIDKEGVLSVNYNRVPIGPDSISAGWYRKVTNFALPDADQNLSKQQYMNNEIRSLHGTIWPLYPEDLWLNAPTKIAEGERKIKQLMVARQLGFTVLETIITSDWDMINSLELRSPGQIAFKMMRGIIADNNQLKGVHTTPLDAAKIRSLQRHTIPFPGLIQPFAEKFREWRITVVGEDVFPAAIYTSKEAKDDWRKHQESDAVTFKAESTPDAINEKCVQYLSQMGLKFGAFDFIEQPDGQIIFLECNPNGQYGWIEDQLGYPIANSIASHLMQIARSNNS